MPTFRLSGFSAFAILSVLVALVSWRVLVLPVAQAMPNMAQYLPDMPVALYAHVVLAPLALFLAPLQLWRGLRLRRPVLHRWMGRVYALAVLLAGLGSLQFLAQIDASPRAALGFGLLALAWIGTTALGVLAAMSGRLEHHRRWMMRSVALSFAAVTLRLMMPVLILNGMTNAESYEITAWACWLPNLIFVEWWLGRREARLA